jgi:thymidine kinase
VAELVFFSGTMDCGKSTLALQMDHNHAARGRAGLIFTKHDRAGVAVLSSRLGLARDAVAGVGAHDIWNPHSTPATHGPPLDNHKS